MIKSIILQICNKYQKISYKIFIFFYLNSLFKIISAEIADFNKKEKIQPAKKG